MHKILLSVAKEHGLVETSFLSADELADLPQHHGTLVQGIRGDIEIEDRIVSLFLVLPVSAPCCLPFIFMRPWDAFGLIPHVDTDGYVCFMQNEGLILDPNRFEEVVSTALSKAIKQVRTGAKRENVHDFIAEFLSYWNLQKDLLTTGSFVDPNDEPKLVQVFVQGTKYSYVCDKEADLRHYLSGSDAEHLTQRNALYVPLPIGTAIIPPNPDIGWSPVEATNIVLECLDARTRKKTAKLCRKLTKQDELVILYLPQTTGNGGALFGLKYHGVHETHPFAGGPTPASLTPVRLLRHDRSLLLPRGGANVELHDKRILVVGCGSVGGFLSVELARSGFGHLTLVDFDGLDGVNVFRHVLGIEHLNEKGCKAELLVRYISDSIPYMDVTAIPDRIEQAINSGTVDLSRFDLVITALGNPATELYLNRLVGEDPTRFPPLIFTWVEAFGIGWHVQVSNNAREEGGCLECLYTNLPGDHSDLHCRASFAKAGQEFGQNISGCSGLFVPYGSATAIHAALLAVETASDVLTGQEIRNPQLSVKGRSRAFTDAGFTLTNRYLKRTNDDLFEQRYAYSNPVCAVCGGR
ncbi:MAG: ThiF family adenylyltransferase [Candidatus Aegiribacteria sp.]|nr:ThiF family adenylyltransferase [Candidatus Aegiribacteria sp.]